MSPLNNEGLQQAESLALRLSSESIEVVISSPLERAKKTAEALVLKCGPDLAFKLDDNLLEVSWGDWEGKPVTPEFAVLSAKWRAGHLEESAPNGESLLSVEQRALRVIEDLKAHEASRIAVVAHGKFLCVLLSLILEGYSHSNPVRGLQNASVSAVEYDPATQAFTCLHLNCCKHLEATK